MIKFENSAIKNIERIHKLATIGEDTYVRTKWCLFDIFQSYQSTGFHEYQSSWLIGCTGVVVTYRGSRVP